MNEIIAALLAGGGTALITALWRAYRRWRFGHMEDEALTTKSAKVAVEAVSEALDELRKERIELHERVRELEGALGQSQIRIRELVAEIATKERRIGELEAQIREALND